MNDVLKESLYKKEPSRFEVVRRITKDFSEKYCGKIIIGNSIFGVVENYSRKKELSLEILRYPFRDDELWAFTFVKKGTIFLCVNSDLAMCKQFFAAAHELYHIHCYAEDTDRSTIASGSLVNSNTVDDTAKTQEDMEANAFAGLLLMSDMSMIRWLLFGVRYIRLLNCFTKTLVYKAHLSFVCCFEKITGCTVICRNLKWDHLNI